MCLETIHYFEIQLQAILVGVPTMIFIFFIKKNTNENFLLVIDAEP